MKILFLNGPPRSGKDAAGAILAEMYDGRTDKFARILKESTHALYGRPFADHDAFESMKDCTSDLFHGITPRQAYIKVSETYMKPTHGEDIFGRLLAKDWKENVILDGDGGLHIITDSGFEPEATALMEAFPHAEFGLIRMHRKGCTFAGDSRSHIELMDPRATLEPAHIPTVDLHNDGTLEDLRSSLGSVVGPAMGLDRVPTYRIAVQLPGGDGSPSWIEVGDAGSLSEADAVCETLRRSSYTERVMRIENTVLSKKRYIYPGDPAVCELG